MDDMLPIEDTLEEKPKQKKTNAEVKKIIEENSAEEEKDSIDYRSDEDLTNAAIIEIAESVDEINKIDRLIFSGTIEDEYPIFNGRHRVRLRTLTIGEDIKVSLAVEAIGSALGRESYGFIAMVETLARSIISLDGEPIYLQTTDDNYVSENERYEKQRKTIITWSKSLIEEIVDSALTPLLKKNEEYVDLLKKG